MKGEVATIVENAIGEVYSRESRVLKLAKPTLPIYIEYPSTRGNTRLELLATNIRDFSTLDYLSVADLACFAEILAEVVKTYGPSKLRIGPGSISKLDVVLTGLRRACNNYFWDLRVAFPEPMASAVRLNQKLPESYRRALKKHEGLGYLIEKTMQIPEGLEVIHKRKWGENRDGNFFRFLRRLAEERVAIDHCLYSPDSQLVGAQLDILLEDRTLFYYCAADTASHPGAGNAILALSLEAHRERMLSQPDLAYSFGRGSELYKYRIANQCRLAYEIIGFFKNDCKTSY